MARTSAVPALFAVTKPRWVTATASGRDDSQRSGGSSLSPPSASKAVAAMIAVAPSAEQLSEVVLTLSDSATTWMFQEVEGGEAGIGALRRATVTEAVPSRLRSRRPSGVIATMSGFEDVNVSRG